MKTLQEMEEFAQEHNIPIMEKEGIHFLCDYIQKHNYTSILEIGSAIGYSAIRMALLHKDMKVVTIEKDRERYRLACENIKDFDLEDQITIHCEDALESEVQGSYDVIFIDAAKAQYIKFFEKYEKLLLPGGIIISDNLSFHGFVENPQRVHSKNLRQLIGKIKRYIQFLENHPYYDTNFLEVGDGLAISRKKSETLSK
ncbi:MAG: O-methyltransferase [Erysipelotrichaceae bacterium]|nr:O-methyltransferase [Erysipelotrichaceae bacterium]